MGLDTVELIIAFEDRFGVKIADEIAATLVTPRKVVDFLMTTPVATLISREEVGAIVRETIIEQTGTADFHEDSHFVYDLNLD